MEFMVDEKCIIQMILEFLRRKQYNEALSSLILETDASEYDLSEDGQFLQRLVLQGRFEDLFEFLVPLKQQNFREYPKVLELPTASNIDFEVCVSRSNMPFVFNNIWKP